MSTILIDREMLLKKVPFRGMVLSISHGANLKNTMQNAMKK